MKLQAAAGAGSDQGSRPARGEWIEICGKDVYKRQGAEGAPYPLAENLKYLVEEEGIRNALLDRYLAQLTGWCAQPEAPECLKTLLAYLSRRTLLADLRGTLPKKLKLHKEESKKAVSYTHLDVYKRQVYAQPRRGGKTGRSHFAQPRPLCDRPWRRARAGLLRVRRTCAVYG